MKVSIVPIVRLEKEEIETLRILIECQEDPVVGTTRYVEALITEAYKKGLAANDRSD